MHETPWKRWLRESSVSAGTNDLTTWPLRSGEQVILDNIAFEDEDNAPTAVKIGLDSGGNILWLREQVSLTGGVVFSERNMGRMSEGERLVVRFEGCTSGDTLNVWVNARMIWPVGTQGLESTHG